MKRYGKFYVADYMYVNGDVQDIMKHLEFIPTKVEHQPWRMAYEYIGISPKFREIEEGDLLPEYDIVFTKEVAGKFYISNMEVIEKDV